MGRPRRAVAALVRPSIISSFYLVLFIVAHLGCYTESDNRGPTKATITQLAVSIATAVAGLPSSASVPWLLGSWVADLLLLLESGALLSLVLYCRLHGLGDAPVAAGGDASLRSAAVAGMVLVLVVLPAAALLQPCLFGLPLLLLPLTFLASWARSEARTTWLRPLVPCVQLYVATWILAEYIGWLVDRADRIAPPPPPPPSAPPLAPPPYAPPGWPPSP